jgi:hypothetical protein
MVPTLFDHLNERREIAKTIPTLYFHESPHERKNRQFDVFQISFCNQPALHVIFGKMRQVIKCWPKKTRSTQFAKILLDQEFFLRFTTQSIQSRCSYERKVFTQLCQRGQYLPFLLGYFFFVTTIL